MNKKQIEAIEILDAIGQENEHEGIKWTKRFMEAFDKREWEKNQIKQEKLGKTRYSKKRYSEVLAGMMNEFLQEMDAPNHNWRSIAYYTEKGVVVQIKNVLGRVFQRAFAPCGIPKIDFQAVLAMVSSAEDTMWRIDKDGDLDVKTKGGVYLK